MLMTNPVIEDNHRVSILAAATKDLFAAKSEEDPSRQPSADILKNVRHKTVVSILRQCEKQIRLVLLAYLEREPKQVRTRQWG